MMDKYKRIMTPVIAALMALGMPLLAHASDNSATIIPAEGSVQCRDYASNSIIESMEEDGPTSLSGPDSDGDGIDETGTYELTNGLKSLEFYDTSVPIDYVVAKSGNTISVIFYQLGGIHYDANITIPGDTEKGEPENLDITAFSLCYGLGNVAEPVPVNLPPVLDPIGDKVATIGDSIEFTVTATDDIDLIDDTVTITASNIPDTANFTSTAALDSTTGSFSWTTDQVGSTNVTFTASDGAAIVTETISITVNDIPPELVVTPTCESIQSLDSTGISCPDPVYDDNGVDITKRSLACNFELDKTTTDGELLNGYGTADGSDVCCICNNNGAPLMECDSTRPPTNDPITSGLPPCTLTLEQKALQNLPPSEVSTHIEINNDPYYCITSLGSRTCYYYSYPF